MNPIDILIIVILLYCLITGITRGLIFEVMGIAGVAVGFFAAFAGFHPLAKALAPYIHGDVLTQTAAWALLFFACLFIARLAAMGIRHLMKTKISIWVDRIAGGFFGLVKGGVVVILVFLVITSVFGQNSTLMTQSRFAPHVHRIVEAMGSAVPDQWKKEFHQENERLKKAWKRQINQIHP